MYSAVQTSVNVFQYQIIFWVLPPLNFLWHTHTNSILYLQVLTFFSATTAESAITVVMATHSRNSTILLFKNPLVITVVLLYYYYYYYDTLSVGPRGFLLLFYTHAATLVCSPSRPSMALIVFHYIMTGYGARIGFQSYCSRSGSGSRVASNIAAVDSGDGGGWCGGGAAAKRNCAPPRLTPDRPCALFPPPPAPPTPHLIATLSFLPYTFLTLTYTRSPCRTGYNMYCRLVTRKTTLHRASSLSVL